MARQRRPRLAVALALTTALVLGTVAVPAGASNRGGHHHPLPWWCTYSDEMDMHHGEDPYPPKADLDWRTCLQLTFQLVPGLLTELQYPTAGDAIDAGYHMVVPYAEGMGAHYVAPGADINEFSLQPQWLLYGGNGRDAPLVGIMYSQYSAPDDPPEGFAGDNDHWHTHPPLCLSLARGLIIAQGLSDAECAAIPGGGVNLDVSSLWMVHVWLWPLPWKPDVFRAHHPALGPNPLV